MQKNEKLVSLLRGVVNATPDLIFAKDLDLVYIVCNESFCKFVDKPEANVVGFRDEDLFEDPEVVEWFRQADRELLRLKKEVLALEKEKKTFRNIIRNQNEDKRYLIEKLNEKFSLKNILQWKTFQSKAFEGVEQI